MVTANCVRKTLQVASASTRTLLSRQSSPPSASYAAKINALPSSPKFSTQKRSLSFSWLPVQLASVEVSLTPLHSATASALFTSLLSLHSNNWGCLSEGFATPL
ncbi:hypothetical protein Lalb_Chr09g0326381 [Lupinus albus]|uniref:Protein NUCLEAR FUSION DEFECTIVE 6, chloroplastic/mitochondrial-like n=1 Tax=Lupinus albus TaxID=3870 RepID=A0A6A4PZZ7_LUPAL|nr:hypothetical protein Lalb_Chr09g0326381 [Lupinus albus]